MLRLGIFSQYILRVDKGAGCTRLADYYRRIMFLWPIATGDGQL